MRVANGRVTRERERTAPPFRAARPTGAREGPDGWPEVSPEGWVRPGTNAPRRDRRGRLGRWPQPERERERQKPDGEETERGRTHDDERGRTHDEPARIRHAQLL